MTCCGTCGTPLPPIKHGARKWCSERCRKEQYAKACSDCGTRIDGTTPGKSKGRCHSCASKAKNYSQRPQSVTARERGARIVAMWGNGDTMGEIARALQTTSGSLGVAMVRMRQDGYDLPYRRTDEQRERMRLAREAAAT